MSYIPQKAYGDKAKPAMTMENAREVVATLEGRDRVYGPSYYDMQMQIANLTACVKLQSNEIERLKSAQSQLLNVLSMVHASENMQNIRIEALEEHKAGRVS